MIQKLIEKTFVLVNFHMQCIVTKQICGTDERFHPLCLENLGSGV
jgi:hypothetical protein